MSDGKGAVLKSDVVILSIKPRRPEFKSDKKYITVKLALQEWDKLDAYYRGQIIKLKNINKALEAKLLCPKSVSRDRKKSSSISGKRRSSTSSGYQLAELFGEDNVTNHSDEENKRPPDRHRSSSRKNRDSKKTEKIKPAKVEDKDDENYLSVARDNFVIEFAIGEKKRTPVHRPDPPGLINPIKVEPYKPPLKAIGFNGVHIQKILYHKTDGNVQHTSPTTTTASTPDNKGLEIEFTPPSHEKSSLSSTKNANASGKGNIESCNVSGGNSTSPAPVPVKRKPESPCSQPAIHPDSPSKRPNIGKQRASSGESLELMPPPRPGPVSLSITEKIIQKSKELPPALKEREKRRQQESLQRRAYALKKRNEHNLMDSVDVSLKALEMIWTQPLLSPIRSP